MTIRKIQRYGWRPDLPDFRDRKLTVDKPVPLPPAIDLSAGMPPVYDQGNLGSCTANAIAAAVDFERALQKEPFVTPSRLFIYYNERVIEGDPAQDNGAEIRDGIKSVADLGICPEKEWPYTENQFAVQPFLQCYTDALTMKALVYSRLIANANSLRHCLAILKRPFVFGFTVYESFESNVVAATGIVPMPQPTEQSVGGHAVLACGYDDARGMFKVRNSWGSSWGLAGYFWIPYAYLTNSALADDFWVIMQES